MPPSRSPAAGALGTHKPRGCLWNHGPAFWGAIRRTPHSASALQVCSTKPAQVEAPARGRCRAGRATPSCSTDRTNLHGEHGGGRRRAPLRPRLRRLGPGGPEHSSSSGQNGPCLTASKAAPPSRGRGPGPPGCSARGQRARAPREEHPARARHVHSPPDVRRPLPQPPPRLQRREPVHLQRHLLHPALHRPVPVHSRARSARGERPHRRLPVLGAAPERVLAGVRRAMTAVGRRAAHGGGRCLGSGGGECGGGELGGGCDGGERRWREGLRQRQGRGLCVQRRLARPAGGRV